MNFIKNWFEIPFAVLHLTKASACLQQDMFKGRQGEINRYQFILAGFLANLANFRLLQGSPNSGHTSGLPWRRE